MSELRDYWRLSLWAVTFFWGKNGIHGNALATLKAFAIETSTTKRMIKSFLR